jgi:hypothetical protein
MALSLTHFNDEDTQPLYVEFLLTPVPRLVTWRLCCNGRREESCPSLEA